MSPAKRGRGRENEGGASRIRETIVERVREEKVVEDEPPPPPPRRPRRDTAREGQQPRSVWDRQFAFFGPSTRDMALFCRQLSTLLDVGVPLLRSLKILSVRTQHPRLKSVVQQVSDEVEQGNRFSTALSHHPRIFSPLFVNVVRVGESGGILEASMRRLAEILEGKVSIQRRIVSAAAYPIVAVTIALIVVTLLLIFAVPRFKEIYDQMGGAFAWPTEFVIGLSDFLRSYWVIIILVIIGVVALMYLFRRSQTGKRTFDWLFLYTPAFSRINRKIAVARTTRTLGSLIAAGIPLLEALRITAQSSENSVVAGALYRVHDTVERGGKLEDQLRHEYHVFNPMVVDMIAVGDEAGALDIMLLKVADNYDEDVEENLRTLTAIVEPALILLVGLLVVFIALAFLLPYFRLATTVPEAL